MEVKYEPMTDFDLHHFGKRHHVHSHYFLFFLFFLLFSNCVFKIYRCYLHDRSSLNSAFCNLMFLKS